MKYICIDYGSKRVGVAVSDERGTIAFPRGHLPNTTELSARVAALAEGEKAGGIIIGDTRALSGAANTITKDVDDFIRDLRTRTTVPVETTWEAWSTFEAARYAPKGEEHNDAAAAAFILQRFLDMRRT